jgi:prephenate dehydrogenase
MKYHIGIVGYGDFTKLMIEHLAPYADIVVSSRSVQMGDAGHGAKFALLEEVLNQPIIIPSIPSQFFESFFAAHTDKIRRDALVIDVCSVKVKPLETLKRLLPSTCTIVGTHPLFGPASVAKNGGLHGLKCVVCPDGEAADEVRAFLVTQLGLEIIGKTAEEHDRDMAYVQGLSHYIGRVMGIMDIPDSPLATLAYDDLLDMKRIQGTDSWELFESIMTENLYAREVNEEFKRACRKLDETISSSNQ